MNLKEEILTLLKENRKSKSDVLWAGSKDGVIDLDLFWELADTEYDDGYGVTDCAEDLLVVGSDFWLERHEYDGSEWFEYKTMPARPQVNLSVRWLTSTQRFYGTDDPMSVWGCTLKEINTVNQNGEQK